MYLRYNMINMTINDKELSLLMKPDFHYLLDGGRITDLEIEGQKILGTYKEEDGKERNTHLCVPNFAKELAEYGLPQHGVARNLDSRWVLLDNNNHPEIQYIMRKQANFPTDLDIRQEFPLGQEFIHKVKVKNIGDQSAAVDLAIHYYFDINPDDFILNDKKITESLWKDENVDIKEINKIQGKNFSFKMEILGTPSVAHVWSGDKDKKRYSCLEPMTGIRELKPGEEMGIVVKMFV